MLLGTQRFEFGDFLLDAKEKVLLRHGERVSLTPKAFDLLLVLINDHGHLVEKDELIEAVWAESFVEEANLPFTVGLLRKALGDNAQEPRFIETVPKRGYRFIADVKTDLDARSSSIGKQQTNEATPKPYVLITVSAILIISLLGFAFVWFRGPDPAVSSTSRLTGSGRVTIAAVSPNGETLVFAQKEGAGESLWRRDLATGDQMQILPPAAVEFIGLTVSPNSDFAYYSVFANNSVTFTLQRVSLGGGSAESISNIESDVSVSFSPDGKKFAYAESHSAVQESLLKTADIDGTNIKSLLTLKGERRALPVFRASPVAWSPDGTTIACAVQETDENDTFFTILLVNTENGSERPLSEQRWGYIENIVWKDSENLAVANVEPHSPEHDIFLISKSTGEARKLAANSADYSWLSAANGHLFAVEKSTYSSIYTVDFPDGSLIPQTRQIFNEPGLIEEVNWSKNDGIFYNSWSSGKNEIWRIDPDGTNPRQLTVDSNLTYGFTVSPTDGKIVLASARNRASSLLLAEANGQAVKRLTEGGEDFRPRFMPDGRDVIFQRGSLIKPTLWRASTISDARSEQLTGYYALQPSVSPDGKRIAYQFMDFEGLERIWRLGLMDSTSGKLLDKLDFPFLVTERRTIWRPGDELLTMAISIGNSSGFLLLSPTDGSYRTIENITADKITSFDWSPDGKRLAFSSSQSTSDAVVVNES